MRSLILCSLGFIVASIGTQVLANAGDWPDPKRPFSTQTPYLAYQDLTTYHNPPAGFSLVYSELLSRHGSRALAKYSYDKVSKEIWQKAQAQGALTQLGKTLGPEIDRLTLANKTLGYGNLSKLGKEELFNIGKRMAQRLDPLLKQSVAESRQVAVEYSGVPRAYESAKVYSSGVEVFFPSIIPLVSEPIKNEKQLYFYKLDKEYQDYIKHDPTLRKAVAFLYEQPKTHQLAQQMLERIYQPTFVQQLMNKEIMVESPSGQIQAYSEVETAIDLFQLYRISQGLLYEAGSKPWQFGQYFSQEEAAWFGYVLDAEAFYIKGPSFKDNDKTYKMAKVLVDDFFAELEKIANGDESNSMKLRFSHAEIVIPFVALMQLEGSEQGVEPSVEFTYRNNPWRGEWVSPYSVNLQWDAYKNAQGEVLVKMLYNEKETKFKASCNPITPSSYFYNLNDLKSCYFIH